MKEINKARYIRGGTRIGPAISEAAKMLGGRSNRKRVAVLLSDAKSIDNPGPSANFLRKLGHKIVAVGIGPQTRYVLT